MTVRQASHNIPSPSIIDQPDSTSWDASSRLVASFHSDPAFLETLQQNGIDNSDPSQYDYQTTLASFGDNYCSAHSEILGQDEMTRIQLLSYAPANIANQLEADYYQEEKRHRRLSDEEYGYYNNIKEFTVWYNQLLSDYLYEHPETHMSTLNKALIESSLRHYRANSTDAEHSIKEVTKGARTEAVARQLLDTINRDEPVLPYDRATAKEDLEGGDIILLHQTKRRGIVRVKVDFKSSLSEIAALNNGYSTDGNTQDMHALSYHTDSRTGKREFSKIVLFPPINDSVLKDQCFLPPRTRRESLCSF